MPNQHNKIRRLAPDLGSQPNSEGRVPSVPLALAIPDQLVHGGSRLYFVTLGVLEQTNDRATFEKVTAKYPDHE